jgi:hypothetical protein
MEDPMIKGFFELRVLSLQGNFFVPLAAFESNKKTRAVKPSQRQSD